jgi:NADP-dependent 3-hydroxy acid dehydrogenase YdfG
MLLRIWPVFVEQILVRGDRVIATARRAESIEDMGSSVVAILQLDVTSDQEILDEIMAKAIAIYGYIDVLVNNAAYVAVGSWEDVSLVYRISVQL